MIIAHNITFNRRLPEKRLAASTLRSFPISGIGKISFWYHLDQIFGTQPASLGGVGQVTSRRPTTDNAKSVVEDVMRIRHHPLVPNDIPIYGYIYDVKSGKLVEVPEATAAGKAS